MPNRTRIETAIKLIEDHIEQAKLHLSGNNWDSLQMDFDYITSWAKRGLHEVTPEKEKK